MAINGALRFLVLKMISKEKTNGASVLKIIEKKTGWKVSPGSFYPLMQELVNLNLVKLEKESNIKFYSITSKGSNFLKGVDEKSKEIIKKIKEGISFLEIFGEKDFIKRLRGNLNRDPIKFIPISEEFVKLDETLDKLNIKKNHKEISKILNNTIQDLKKIK